MSITPSEAQIARIYKNANIVFGASNSYNLNCKVNTNRQFVCILNLSDNTELIHTRPYNTAQEAWDDIDKGLQKEVDRRSQAQRERILANCRTAWGKYGSYAIECRKHEDSDGRLWKATVVNGDGTKYGETASFATEDEAWKSLEDMMEMEVAMPVGAASSSG